MTNLEEICYFIAATCILAIGSPLLQPKAYSDFSVKSDSLAWLLLAHAAFLNALIATVLLLSMRRPEIREVAWSLSTLSLIVFLALSATRYFFERSSFALVGIIVSGVGCFALLAALLA